jgi:hypothetical protein
MKHEAIRMFRLRAGTARTRTRGRGFFMNDERDRLRHDPTREQILDRCADIQSWWSWEMEILRSHGIRTNNRTLKDYPHLAYQIQQIAGPNCRVIRKTVDEDFELFDSEYWNQG